MTDTNDADESEGLEEKIFGSFDPESKTIKIDGGGEDGGK